MAQLPGNAGGPQPVQEQGAITCTYEADVNSFKDQKNTDGRATPWYVPEAHADDRTYSIDMYDPLCKVEECPGLRGFAPMHTGNTHARLISALNGLRVPREVSAALDKLKQSPGTQDIRRAILDSYISFKGINVAPFSYNSKHGGTNADLARAMYVTGVCQQPVRLGQSFAIGDPVRFVTPIEDDIKKQNFFTAYDGTRQQRGKVMMYLTRVDARRSYKLMRSTLRDYLRDPQGLRAILQQSSEAEKKIMPMFAMPEYLQRVLHTAMIMGQYLGIRAGVLQARGPARLNNLYRSSYESRPPEQSGYKYYDYSDALHYIRNGAGALSFPDANTAVNEVNTFGMPVRNDVTADDAAFDYLILALQMSNLMLKQDPPVDPQNNSYRSEGFFSVVSDPNNVQERSAKRFRELLDAGCRNMAASMFQGEDYGDNVVGSNPRTGINTRVFKVGRDTYIDKNRDAGVAACVVSGTLASYLQIMATAAHEMTRSHGVVIAGGKEVVKVFVGRSAV